MRSITPWMLDDSWKKLHVLLLCWLPFLSLSRDISRSRKKKGLRLSLCMVGLGFGTCTMIFTGYLKYSPEDV